MKIDITRPGFAFSLLGHGTLLAVLIAPLWWLAAPPLDDNTPEAVPVDTISENAFNQIMKGEKSSKDTTKPPTTKADKVADIDEQHTQPPDPEVKKETPPPPPPKPAAPTPPTPVTPPVAPAPPPVPEPPQRPDPAPPLPPDAPTPPVPKPAPKPAPVKPAPPAPMPPERDPDAEVIKPAPPPPKPVPKPPEPPKHAEAKPPPVPTPPQPPKVPERPAPHKPDQLAKLVEQTQEDADPTPEAKPAPKAHAKPAPHAKPSPAQTAAADATAEPSDSKAFDPSDISRILSQPSGAPPSTGHALSKTATRGATTGNAPKMSPSQSDALDGLLADQFKQCWSYLGLDHGRYIPEIKVAYAQDGSLQSEPQLLNRPSEPNARSLAESALRAVRQCNPLHIPAIYAPYYDQWRSRILRFDPAEMAG